MAMGSKERTSKPMVRRYRGLRLRVPGLVFHIRDMVLLPLLLLDLVLLHPLDLGPPNLLTSPDKQRDLISPSREPCTKPLIIPEVSNILSEIKTAIRDLVIQALLPTSSFSIHPIIHPHRYPRTTLSLILLH